MTQVCWIVLCIFQMLYYTFHFLTQFYPFSEYLTTTKQVKSLFMQHFKKLSTLKILCYEMPLDCTNTKFFQAAQFEKLKRKTNEIYNRTKKLVYL